MVEKLYQLVDEPKILDEVPITLDIVNKYICGIIGSRKEVVDFAKGMILQITALHSYDEVKLVFIYNSKESDIWNSMRWLPHAWSADKAIRFTASNQKDIKELSAFFEKEIKRRENINSEQELEEVNPHYIIFSTDKDMIRSVEMTDMILKHKKYLGFSLINLFDEIENDILTFERIAEKTVGNPFVAAQILTYECELYYKTKNFTKLEEKIEKLLKSDVSADQNMSLYFYLSILSMHKKDDDNFSKYISMCLPYFEEYKNVDRLTAIYKILGKQAEEKRQYKQASEYYFKLAELLEKKS